MNTPGAVPTLRGQLAVVLVVVLSLTVVGVGPAAAAPTVTGATAGYTEQAPPTTIGGGISITGGTSYDGQYVDFDIADSSTHEHLSLPTQAVADTAAGVVSIVGSGVYLGTGSEAQPIGTLDPVHDGTAGRKLRVNFTSPFDNPGFEDADLTAWNAMRHHVNLGMTQIAGFTSVDTATYPGNAGNQDDDTPVSASWAVEVTTDGSPTEGSYALRLRSSMTTANGCDVVHGPAVYSNTFEAAAGDSIYFDWRAFAGNDAYHVFGYILDAKGNQTEVLDAYTTDAGGSTNWATKKTVIPATGTYRFVFVAGTYDATCGKAAGAQLLIDNVRVFGNKVNDTVLTDLARQLRYENTSDDPAASRTVTVTALSAQEGSGSGSLTVEITPVDDPPALSTPGAATFTNTMADDVFDAVYGTLSVTDPDSTVFTFDAEGATGTGWRSATGTYATVRVHADSGAYVVEPHDAAIEASTTATTETFTLSVSADGATVEAPLTVNVAIAASPPGPPSIQSAVPGDSQVTLNWQPHGWLGGSATSDYVVEYSTDGGVTWTPTSDAISADTQTTITSLTPGVAHRFRVAATNATGTGDWSAASDPVTPKTHQAPLSHDPVEVTYGDAVELVVSGGSGEGDVTFDTDAPCVLTGAVLSASSVGTCTVTVTKAADTTYYETSTSVAVTVAPKPLTVTGATVSARQYDGTTQARISGAALVGIVGDDTVGLFGHGTGTFAQPTPGWFVPVSTTMSLVGADAGNYTVVQPDLTGRIDRRTVTVAETRVESKVYDGTTDATLAGATPVGLLAGDEVSLGGTSTGRFTDATAGTGKPVSTAMVLDGADASNYQLVQPRLTGTISRRAVTVAEARTVTKTYDRTLEVAVAGAELSGLVLGDDVALADADRGTLARLGVGSGIAVTTAMSLIGADADNYAVVQPRLTATVRPKELTVSAARVQRKAYDGSTRAIIRGARLQGVADGDDVTLVGHTAGTFHRAEVGVGIPVTTAMALDGTDRGNYTLAVPTLTGDILPAPTMQTDDVPTADGGAAGRRTFAANDPVVTQLCDLAPNSRVAVLVDGFGGLVGEATTDADGCVLVTAVLPSAITAGEHLLRFEAVDAAGMPTTLTRTITVTAPPAAAVGPLPMTGANLAVSTAVAIALLALGAAMVRVSGRRRRMSGPATV